MKEIIVHPLPTLTTELIDSPLPIAKADEVIIKVVVAGSNVKDWMHPTALKISINSGDDIAGIVHDLGDTVAETGEFHIGDRVAAFHPMLTLGGAYAEYAVAPSHTVFKLPNKTSFEEAATIPLCALTVGISLFHLQGLPTPWAYRSNSSAQIPLIIYGASSAMGSFAIKLAKASNIHPIIAICGGTQELVAKLLDSAKGDTIVDYRQGPEIMKKSVKAALGSLVAEHALDCISDSGTWVPLAQMLTAGGQVSVLAGSNKYDDADIPQDVEMKYTYVGTAHTGAYKPSMPKQPLDKESVEVIPEFAYIFYRYVERMLARGTLEGHPYDIVPGGLDGVQTGLQNLKAGKNKGQKYIYRIADTKSLS